MCQLFLPPGTYHSTLHCSTLHYTTLHSTIHSTIHYTPSPTPTFVPTPTLLRPLPLIPFLHVLFHSFTHPPTHSHIHRGVRSSTADKDKSSARGGLNPGAGLTITTKGAGAGIGSGGFGSGTGGGGTYMSGYGSPGGSPTSAAAMAMTHPSPHLITEVFTPQLHPYILFPFNPSLLSSVVLALLHSPYNTPSQYTL